MQLTVQFTVKLGKARSWKTLQRQNLNLPCTESFAGVCFILCRGVFYLLHGCVLSFTGVCFIFAGVCFIFYMSVFYLFQGCVLYLAGVCFILPQLAKRQSHRPCIESYRSCNLSMTSIFVSRHWAFYPLLQYDSPARQYIERIFSEFVVTSTSVNRAAFSVQRYATNGGCSI